MTLGLNSVVAVSPGGGGDSSMIHMIHCKNFCKWHNVSPPSTTKRKKKGGMSPQ
jgi:hypothetical protein